MRIHHHLFAIAILGLLSCENFENDNPYSAAYVGDYSFKLITLGLPDTIATFCDYTIAYTTGKDTFLTILPENLLIGSMDTIGFCDRENQRLNIRFIKEFDGSVTIAANTPNGQEFKAMLPLLVVIDSFAIHAATESKFDNNFKSYLRIMPEFAKSFIPDSMDSIMWSFPDTNILKGIKDSVSYFIRSYDDLVINAQIIDKHKNKSRQYNRILKVLSPDTVKPETRFYYDYRTVASELDTMRIAIVSKDESAIDSLIVKYAASSRVVAQKANDTVWYALISLTPYDSTHIIATAYDHYNNKNSCSTAIFYDPSLTDRLPPAIVKISGPNDSSRVVSDTGTLVFSIMDFNRIDTVISYLNDSTIPTKRIEDGKYLVAYSLHKYGENTIRLFAWDKSSRRNVAHDTILIIYNTMPARLSSISPSDSSLVESYINGQTLSWQGGTDPDGDSVKYSVYYGTDTTNLTMLSTSNKSASINGLSNGQKISWYVKVCSALDTVRCPQSSFYHFTINDTHNPVITQLSGAVTESKVTTDTGTITFSIIDTNGIDSAYWLQDNVLGGNLSKTDSIYSSRHAFTSYGLHSIKVVAVDKSHLKSEKTIVLDYRSGPKPITSISPASNATLQRYRYGINLSWQGGDDPDGDTVTYRLYYGTNPASFSVTELRDKSFALSYISNKTTYYWYLKMCTVLDTVRSPSEEGSYYSFAINDDQAPAYTKISGPNSGDRTITGTGTLRYTFSDSNGVDSVYFAINGTFAGSAQRLANNEAQVDFTLSAYGNNTITVYAKDSTSPGNLVTIPPINIYYNTVPSGITSISPSDVASIENYYTGHTLSWQGGTDPDGDTVKYSLFYGTDTTNLTKIIRSNKSASITGLSNGQKIYWYVKVCSALDTVKCPQNSFYSFTINDTHNPVITQLSGAVTGNRVLLDTGTIAFAITDTNGIKSAYWLQDNVQIGNLTKTGSVYSLKHTFTTFGQHSIRVVAVDNSNLQSQTTITLDYRTKPQQITSITPASNSTLQGYKYGITLGWQGGDDPDGDTVTYRIYYGTNPVSFSFIDTKNKAYALSNLTNQTTIYWYMNMCTIQDTVRSPSDAGTYYSFIINDNQAPAYTKLSGPYSGDRITSGTGTLRYTITDSNGIDSVYYAINGTFAGPAQRLANNEVRVDFMLSSYGSNTITVYAKDSTTPGNILSIPITLVYNTIPSAASSLSPASGTTQLENLSGIALSWSAAVDADGDAITYKLYYGTDTAGTMSTVTTTLLTSTLNGLTGDTKYFWYLKACTVLDTVRSPASGYSNFSTKNHPATITAFPDISSTINDTVVFNVSATDAEGVYQYQWDFGNNGTIDSIKSAGYMRFRANSVAGTYPVCLHVVDNKGAITKDTAILNVTNYSPTCNAGPDSIGLGFDAIIYLDATASDDATGLIYDWSFDNKSTWRRVANGDTSFAAPKKKLPQLLKYFLRVTDNDGNTTMDSLKINVTIHWDTCLNTAPYNHSTFYVGFNNQRTAYLFDPQEASGLYKLDISANAVSATWQSGSNVLPRVVYNTELEVSPSGELYMAGGWYADFTMSKEIWYYDGLGTYQMKRDMSTLDSYFQNGFIEADLMCLTGTTNMLQLTAPKNNSGARLQKTYQSTNNGANWACVDSAPNMPTTECGYGNRRQFYNDSIWNLTMYQSQNTLTVRKNGSYNWQYKAYNTSNFYAPNYKYQLVVGKKSIFVCCDSVIYVSSDRGASFDTLTTDFPFKLADTDICYAYYSQYYNKPYIFTKNKVYYSNDLK